jgi:hypothetical protein
VVRQVHAVRAVLIFDGRSGAYSETKSRRGLAMGYLVSQRNNAPLTRTWTSFSPKETWLTMFVRAILSGFGFFLYSASRTAWSSGLWDRTDKSAIDRRRKNNSYACHRRSAHLVRLRFCRASNLLSTRGGRFWVNVFCEWTRNA